MMTRPMTELFAAGAIGYGAARVLGADRRLGPAVAIALWASAYVPGLPPGPGRIMGTLTGAIAGAVNPDATINGSGAGTADDPQLVPSFGTNPGDLRPRPSGGEKLDE
jgi:hypothetical protein